MTSFKLYSDPDLVTFKSNLGKKIITPGKKQHCLILG